MSTVDFESFSAAHMARICDLVTDMLVAELLACAGIDSGLLERNATIAAYAVDFMRRPSWKKVTEFGRVLVPTYAGACGLEEEEESCEGREKRVYDAMISILELECAIAVAEGPCDGSRFDLARLARRDVLGYGQSLDEMRLIRVVCMWSQYGTHRRGIDALTVPEVRSTAFARGSRLTALLQCSYRHHFSVSRHVVMGSAVPARVVAFSVEWASDLVDGLPAVLEVGVAIWDASSGNVRHHHLALKGAYRRSGRGITTPTVRRLGFFPVYSDGVEAHSTGVCGGNYGRLWVSSRAARAHGGNLSGCRGGCLQSSAARRARVPQCGR